MPDSLPHEAFLPFGYVKFNEVGDVVKIVLQGKRRANYEGAAWCKVTDAIMLSPALKEIALTGYHRDSYRQKNALAAVFGRERTHPCMLEKFDAEESILGPENLALMLPFFKSTPEIKNFSFVTNKLGDEGTRLLSEALSHTRVEYLNLWKNGISGEGLDQLFSAENSKHLHKLDLQYNGIGAHGLDAICRFLQRDDTEMRKLYFDVFDLNEFRTPLESISPQSKLVELFNEDGWEDYLEEESTAVMSQILKNIVCNTDTFEGLCESNHQLIWVGPHTLDMLKSDPILKKAIMINNQLAHGASIVSRLRSKLRAFYFQGQFDVQPFIGMNIIFMPFVLALVTRTERLFSTDDNDERGRWTERDFSMDNTDESDDESNTYESGVFSEPAGGKCVTVMEGDLGSVYHLVRNCHLPELFTFSSSKSRIRKDESRILSLEEENARLTAENEELRSRFGRPLKKRAKK